MHLVANALKFLFIVRAVSGARLEVDDNLVESFDTTNAEFDYYDYAPDVGASQGELAEETDAYDGSSSTRKKKWIFGSPTRRRRTVQRFSTNFDIGKVFEFESCKQSSLASISDDHFLSEPSANESGWSKELTGASNAESPDMTNDEFDASLGELVQASDVYDINTRTSKSSRRRRRSARRRRSRSSARRRSTKVAVRAKATNSYVTVRRGEIQTVGTLTMSLTLNHTFTKGWQFNKTWSIMVYQSGVLAVYLNAGVLFKIEMTGNAGFQLALPVDWDFCVGVHGRGVHFCPGRSKNKVTARSLSFKHWLGAHITGSATVSTAVQFETASILSVSAQVQSTMTLSTRTGCNIKFEYFIKSKALKTVTYFLNWGVTLVRMVGICLNEFGELDLGKLTSGVLATMRCTR